MNSTDYDVSGDYGSWCGSSYSVSTASERIVESDGEAHGTLLAFVPVWKGYGFLGGPHADTGSDETLASSDISQDEAFLAYEAGRRRVARAVRDGTRFFASTGAALIGAVAISVIVANRGLAKEPLLLDTVLVALLGAVLWPIAFSRDRTRLLVVPLTLTVLLTWFFCPFWLSSYLDVYRGPVDVLHEHEVADAMWVTPSEFAVLPDVQEFTSSSLGEVMIMPLLAPEDWTGGTWDGKRNATVRMFAVSCTSATCGRRPRMLRFSLSPGEWTASRADAWVSLNAPISDLQLNVPLTEIRRRADSGDLRHLDIAQVLLFFQVVNFDEARHLIALTLWLPTGLALLIAISGFVACLACALWSADST